MTIHGDTIAAAPQETATASHETATDDDVKNGTAAAPYKPVPVAFFAFEGLIALRVGVHLALGAAGVHATSPAAHLAFALLMCATTVGLLAFDQKVLLRALNAQALRAAPGAAVAAS